MIKEQKEINIALVLELLDKGLDVAIFPKGGSMKPMIRDNEKIIVRKVPAGALKPADVVFYLKENGFIVHRIIKSANGCFRIKGDCASEYDALISAEKIKAKVVKVIKRRGVLNLEKKKCAFLNRLLKAYSVGLAFFCHLALVFVKWGAAKMYARVYPWTYEVLHQVGDIFFYPLIWFLLDKDNENV